ncbi:nitrate/nitrite transporter NrtS [Candidatus Poribacteria bacterium]|nr:nitrate/nitrite transporter NrtS [Candidatus Poribacteria bacterium]
MTAPLAAALSKPVVRRSLRVAGVVGSILLLVNHGDAILARDVSIGRVVRILLTYLVPYGVSTYSSVMTMRCHDAPRCTDVL